MGSHGLMGKQNMYEHTIGVPLIMAGPLCQPESNSPHSAISAMSSDHHL